MAKTADTLRTKTFNTTEDMADAYIKYVFKLLKNGEFKRAVDKAGEGKIRIESDLKRKRTTIWEIERIAQQHNVTTEIVEMYYTLCLFRSFWKLEDFILYMERNRPQSKRFYLPRRNPFHIITEDIEDLFNRKIKLLGIELPPRTGKALAFDTPVLTKEGWKKHGDLTTFDYVIGGDGKFKQVLAVHPPCKMEYKVTFADGEEIICHGNHEWVVYDRYKMGTTTIETKAMVGKEIDKDDHRRFSVLYTQVDTPDRELAVDPYTLGVWLGDGRNTNPDIVMAKEDVPVIADIMTKYPMAWWTEHKETGVMHYGIRGLRKQLQTYNMCFSRHTKPKHIPDEYLTASKKQRLELLAGLLDTDGTLTRKEHRYHFSTTELMLRDGFIALVNSLGWRASVSVQEPKLSSSGVQGRKEVYTIGFNPTEHIPCRLMRKQLNEFSKQRRITIEKVEPIDDFEHGNCITVEDGVYLVGKTLKPTHNSTISLFGTAWLTMKRPNSHSAIGTHSGVLAEGFYDEAMNFYTSEEYTFKEIYQFWNGTEREIIQDKSAEHMTINLDLPDRMNTITFRGIDGTWTGAVDISWDGVLTVDDLVRDRTHALSPTRMEGTWNEYLNKMHDRLNPFVAKNYYDPREFDLQGTEVFSEPPEMMIGTLWNIYDPLYRYERAYENDPLYRFRKIPALNEDNESNFSYIPTSYFINQREILSEADFAAKFQQAPFVREGLLFARDELNYFDGNLPNDKYKIIAVLDPAVGGGDFLSMPIIACGKKKFVIDWIYDNRTRGKTVPRILRKLINHKVVELYFENNGIGRAFEDPIKDGLKKESYFGIKVKTFNAPEHMNKNEKISYYADAIKSELHFIEEGSKGTYKRSQDYIDALWSVNTFTTEGKNAHDDAPDSLAQVMRVMEEQSNGTIDIILNPFR